MLVSEELAEKMYSKEGFLYKNFTFLFQNALWHKSMPSGFAICPYFWLSLVGILFRYFIHCPVKYVVKPAWKGCKRLASMSFHGLSFLTCGGLKKFDRGVNWCGVKIGFPGTNDVGLPTSILSLGSLCIISGIILFQYIAGFYGWVLSFGVAGFTIPLIVSSVLLVGLVVSAVLSVKQHKCSNHHFIYPLGLLILTTVLSLIYTPYAIPGMFGALWGFLCAIFSVIATLVVAICTGIFWFVESIWLCILLAMPTLLELAPILAIVLGILLFAAVVGLAIEKWLPAYTAFPKPVENKVCWREAWIQVLIKACHTGSRNRMILRHFDNISDKDHASKTYICDRVYREYVIATFSDELDVLEKCQPRPNRDCFCDNVVGLEVYEIVKSIGEKHPNFLEIRKALYDISDKLDEDYYSSEEDAVKKFVAPLVKSYKDDLALMSKIKRFENRCERYTKNWARVETLCSKVCASAKPIVEKSKTVGQWFKLGWKILVKSKKEVCPWKQFHD